MLAYLDKYYDDKDSGKDEPLHFHRRQETTVVKVSPLTTDLFIMTMGLVVKLAFAYLSRMARYRDIDQSLLDI